LFEADIDEKMKNRHVESTKKYISKSYTVGNVFSVEVFVKIEKGFALVSK